LNEDMLRACSVYAQWLADASKVTEDDKVKYLVNATHLNVCKQVL